MKVPVALRAAQVDAYAPNRNAGQLRIYAGPVPASSEAPLGAVTLLATMGYAAVAFAPASVLTATATAAAMTPEPNAPAGGVPSFARAYVGAVCVGQHTVSVFAGGGEVQFAALLVNAGEFVVVLIHTLTQPDGP